MQKRKAWILALVLILFVFAVSFRDKTAVTLIQDHGDGMGSYRLFTGAGSGTFRSPLAAGDWKTERTGKKGGEWRFRIPGTDGSLTVRVSFFQEKEQLADCMERDVSYYKNIAKDRGGFEYLDTGWQTRSDTLVCFRFCLRYRRGTEGTRYLGCAVVCSVAEMAEYLFVLESDSEETARAFESSFVYTPAGKGACRM